MDFKLIVDRATQKTYSRGRKLGSGGFASCYELIDCSSKQVYAAKIIAKQALLDKKERKKMLHQIRIHRQLSHPNIVQLHSCLQDSQNVYILLELCPHHTLKELLKRRKRLSELEVRVYFKQMVNVLQYLHSLGIIHRDIKLGNVMVGTKLECKMGDFGLSTRVKQNKLKHTICGTPNYIAPEIIEQKGHSFQVDIWSLGVILYALLYGKPPFESSSTQKTYDNIIKVQFNYPSSYLASYQANDLIQKLLKKQPSSRLKLSQILRHPFLNPPYEIPTCLPLSSLAIPPTGLQMCLAVEQNLLQSRVEKTDFDDQEEELFLKKNRTVFCTRIMNMQEGIAYELNNGAVGVLLYSGGGILKTPGRALTGVDGKQYLEPQDQLCIQKVSNSFRSKRADPFLQTDVYASKYIKTTVGTLLKLNTGIFQMVFNDGSLVAGEVFGQGQMIYVDRQGKESAASGPSFQKRMLALRQSLKKVQTKLGK